MPYPDGMQSAYHATGRARCRNDDCGYGGWDIELICDMGRCYPRDEDQLYCPNCGEYSHASD